MAIKGLTAARSKTKRLSDSIENIKAQRAVTAGVIVGQGWAQILTPVDTSFLINGQYRRVSKSSVGYAGQVGYVANYAAAVHAASNKQNFKKPGAGKEFLRKGFEDHRAQIDAAVLKAFSL
jgi:hypothetical protein